MYIHMYKIPSFMVATSIFRLKILEEFLRIFSFGFRQPVIFPVTGSSRWKLIGKATLEQLLHSSLDASLGH